ncbi:MAG: IS200/IS605 family transposase [Chloroflexi bacterium]|nr:MAG: IS200/IS605 family transposase [Chloroflexota bacterium]
MSYWMLYYHFTWATKERLPLILPSFEAELYRVIAAKVIEMEGIVHAIGGTVDHVHLAASVPPKLALAEFIGDVKGNSSHYVNHVIKPDLAFYWQNEYAVLSFGEKNLATIVRYIHNQKKHHAEGTLQPPLERF